MFLLLFVLGWFSLGALVAAIWSVIRRVEKGYEFPSERGL